MKKCILALCVALVLCLTAAPSFGAEATAAKIGKASAEDKGAKFERYRQAILKEHGIDIRKYKERLKVGRADGKDITRYDLDQLIRGIKVEREHTTDRMLALEIATDHLDEFPNYYTLLEEMEEEAEKALKEKEKKGH